MLKMESSSDPTYLLQNMKTSILQSLMISTNIYRFTFMVQVLGWQEDWTHLQDSHPGALTYFWFLAAIKSNQALKYFKSDR